MSWKSFHGARLLPAQNTLTSSRNMQGRPETSCVACRRLRRKCTLHPGERACTRCCTAGRECLFLLDYRKVATRQALPPTDVRAGVHLERFALSCALQFHLMQLFLKQSGGGELRIGVGVKLVARVAELRGKTSELDPLSKIVALAQIAQGGAISNHSLILGQRHSNVPVFGTNLPNSDLSRFQWVGFARHAFVTAAQRQIVIRMERLIATRFQEVLLDEGGMEKLHIGIVSIMSDHRTLHDILRRMIGILLPIHTSSGRYPGVQQLLRNENLIALLAKQKTDICGRFPIWRTFEFFAETVPVWLWEMRTEPEILDTWLDQSRFSLEVNILPILRFASFMDPRATQLLQDIEGKLQQLKQSPSDSGTLQTTHSPAATASTLLDAALDDISSVTSYDALESKLAPQDLIDKALEELE